MSVFCSKSGGRRLAGRRTCCNNSRGCSIPVDLRESEARIWSMFRQEPDGPRSAGFAIILQESKKVLSKA